VGRIQGSKALWGLVPSKPPPKFIADLSRRAFEGERSQKSHAFQLKLATIYSENPYCRCLHKKQRRDLEWQEHREFVERFIGK